MVPADLVTAQDDSDDAPAGSETEDGDEELLEKLTAWERRSRSHYSKWRDEARRSYDFVAGNQWTSDDRAQLLDEMRQPITFNRCGPMVDAVIGAEVLNRQEVRYSPREVGDSKANEVITGAAKWARDLCDAEDEESDAFSDTIVCGMGWTETRMDYEADPEGQVKIDRIDPLEMWTDPSSKKRNLADARYHFRARHMQRDELKPEWRKKIGSGGDDGSDMESSESGESSRGDDYEHGPSEVASKDADRKTVWVRHFQWWDLVDSYRMSDPASGQVATMKADEYKAAVKMFLANGLQPPEAMKVRTRQHYYAIVAGGSVLETGEVDAGTFTFHCVTGKRDRNTNTWYGVVRAMTDPQMWANKWFSQILHVLNTSAKGGVMHERGAIKNLREFNEKWAKPGETIEVEPGALTGGKIKEREPANYPQGMDRLLSFAVESMPQVTGINLELLGLVQKEQAGVLEAQRKQAGYAILAVFFDSLRRYRKMQGRVMLYFIEHYLSDGRLVRIVGNNAAQYVPLVRQPGTAKYDVVVDDAPMSANQKDMVWGMLTQMMPLLMKQPLGPDVWAKLFEYSPLPASVSSALSEAMIQASQPDPAQQQMQQAAQQAELRKMTAAAEKDETLAHLNQARTIHTLQPPAPARRESPLH